MTTFIAILQYFFDPLPSDQFRYQYVAIGIAIVFFAASIVTKIYLKKSKDDKILRKLFRTLPGRFLILGVSETIYGLARYERMAFFSMRILHYIILASAAYLIYSTIQTYRKEYSTMAKRREEQIKLNQYLPRKKGRK